MRNELKGWAWMPCNRRNARRDFFLLSATFVCVTSLVLPAWAKPSAEELAVARQQFDKAVAAEGRNDWVECEHALSEAIGIVETPGLRFHQAHCKEQQNKWVEALVDYKRAEELIAGGVKASDVEPLLAPAINRLEGKVPRLTVRVLNSPEQTTLYLDGKERSSKLLGKVVQLNPGSHTVEVAAPGYATVAKTISLEEGEQSDLQLTLMQKADEPKAASTTTPETTPSYSSKGKTRERGSKPVSFKPFVLAGEGAIAAVALGLSIKFYTDKQSFGAAKDRKLENWDGRICSPTEPDQECEDLARVTDNEKRHGRYALYSGIGAAAAVAVLVTTWLAWDDSPRVVVAYDPTGGASFTLGGTF